MRLIVQRVLEAKVTVRGLIVGAIQQGFVVLLGIHREDQIKDIPWFIHKLIHLRVFNDKNGKLNLNIKEVKGQILLVSQFTLYGNCLSGRRPDFLQAAPPAVALPIYHEFVKKLSQEVEVQTGQFGEDMQLSLVNDGPVTLIVESEK